MLFAQNSQTVNKFCYGHLCILLQNITEEFQNKHFATEMFIINAEGQIYICKAKSGVVINPAYQLFIFLGNYRYITDSIFLFALSNRRGHHAQ